MSDTTDKKGLKYFGIIHNIPKNLLISIPSDVIKQLGHGCVELFTHKRDANKRLKEIKNELVSLIKENKGYTHSEDKIAVMTPSEYIKEYIHLDVKEYTVSGMANTKRNKEALVKHLDKTINLIEYFHSDELAVGFTEDSYRVLINDGWDKKVQMILENPY